MDVIEETHPTVTTGVSSTRVLDRETGARMHSGSSKKNALWMDKLHVHDGIRLLVWWDYVCCNESRGDGSTRAV